jgi:hypothetical protein
MRVFFGMILGALFLTGVVFIADTWTTGPAGTTGSPPRAEQRTMVNWDVVRQNLNTMGDSVQQAWNTLVRKVTS